MIELERHRRQRTRPSAIDFYARIGERPPYPWADRRFVFRTLEQLISKDSLDQIVCAGAESCLQQLIQHERTFEQPATWDQSELWRRGIKVGCLKLLIRLGYIACDDGRDWRLDRHVKSYWVQLPPLK